MNIIIAGNISQSIITELSKCGFKLHYAPENPRVLKGLGFHPDMQIAGVGSTFVCEPSMYCYYNSIFAHTPAKLVCGKASLQCNYPKDIAYNIKVIGNTVFHKFAHTDSVLSRLFSGMTMIDVSQGYSGCSICKVSDSAIITSDKGIHEKAQESGISSLLIRNGCIELEHFDYGFIGGASFFCDDTVYFFGDVSHHPDYDNIESFCRSAGSSIVTLGEDPLTDYGGAITF